MASELIYLKPASVLRCILLIAFSLSVGVLALQDHGRIYEQEQVLELLEAEGINVLPIDKLPLARPIQSRSSQSDKVTYLLLGSPEELSGQALEQHSSQSGYYNAFEQDYWSSRSMGRRSVDELGFPVVTSTSDNYHYNVNWAHLGQAKRHKRASPTQRMTKVSGVIDTLDDLLVGESRRTERRGVEPEPKRDYKGQTQEYDGPYIYTQLFGPPYEIGYIRSPVPSKHVYDDYLQFVRSWSSGARDAVDSGAYKVDNYRGDVSSKDAEYKSNKDADYSPKPAYSEPKKESYDNKPYSAPTESYSAPEKGSYDTKDADYGKSSSSSYEAPKAAYTDNKKDDDDYVAKGADRDSNYDAKKTYTEPNKKGDNYRESSYEAKQPSRDTAYDSKPASVEYRETSKGYDNPPVYSAPKAAASYSDDGYKSNRDNYDTPSYSTSDKGSSYSESKSYEAPPTYMKPKAPAHTEDGYSRGKESMPMYDAKPKGDTYSPKGSSYPEETYSTTPYSAMKAVYSTPFYPVKESYNAPAASPAKYDNPPKSAATYDNSYDSKSHSSGYEESSKGYQAPAAYSTKAAPYSNDGHRGDKDSYDTPTYSSSSKGGSSYTETRSYEAPPTKANYDSKPAAYISDDGYGRGKDTSYEAPPSKALYIEDTKPYKAPMAAYVDEEYSAPKTSSHDDGYKTAVAKDYKAPTTYEEKEYSVPKASSSSYDDGYKTSVAKDYKAPATYDEKEYSAPKASSGYDDGYRNTNTKDYKAPSTYEDKEYVAPKASASYDDGYKGSNTKDYKAPAAPSAYPDKEYSAPKASGSYDDGYKTSSGPASYSDEYSASSQKGSGSSSYGGNKDDYDSESYKASGKDYASTEAYPLESTTKKHHYPVIIGRYQVTDSKAFLPVSVNGEKGGNSGSSDGNYVDGGTYTAKGPNDEYVVYYLPYGQPLPVKLRKRSVEPYSSSYYTSPIDGSVKETTPETRSVTTLARLHSSDHLRLPLRSLNDSSFSPENNFLPQLTNISHTQNLTMTETEVPASSITDPSLDFVTTRLDMDLSELISHLEFEAQPVELVTLKNDSHSNKTSVGNFDASDEFKSQLLLLSTATSTQEPDLVKVQISSTVVSHSNLNTKSTIPSTYSTTKTPAEPLELTSSNNAGSIINEYVKGDNFQSSRILPGFTQRPVRYIDSSSDLASKDIAQWNGYTTWWTKLGNKIANVHNYE